MELSSSSRPCSLLLVVSLLDHDEEEMLVGRNEDLLSLGTDSEEGHVIHGVDVADDGTRLDGQVRDVVGDVLGGRRRRGLVALRNDPALIVDDQERTDALVITDAVDALLEVCHLFKI